MFALLQGYKTYIVGLIGLAYAGVMLWNGADPKTCADIALAALGVMGLRGGLATEARLILSALGVLPPDNPTRLSMGKVKDAVLTAAVKAKRIAPVLAVLLVAGLSLAACSTSGGGFFDNPQNDLSIAEDGLTAAQVLYNTICAANSAASYCSAQAMATANDAAALARDAIRSARLILANANSTDAQIDAAIDGVRKAVAHFRDLIADLNAAKMKALQRQAAPA